MNSDRNNTCPVCGVLTCYFEQGLSCGWECSACGWSVVTTNQEHPAFDTTLYHLWPVINDKNRKGFISAAAALLGIDIREARSRIDNRLPLADGLLNQEASLLQGRFANKGLVTRIEPASKP